MPAPLDASGLKKLALRLAAEGPTRLLDTPKRIRVLFRGKYVADTTEAKYVWEHPWYPQYYIPFGSIQASLPSSGIRIVEELQNAEGKTVAKLLELHVAENTLKNVICFEPDLKGDAAPLSSLVKVDFKEADQWFEEDTPIFVHPKDPFKRIEIIHSNRPVRVSVDGVVLAEAASSLHLYETGLPRRFYLPLPAVRQEYLRPSSTKSQCPYKGEAEYYDVVLEGGKTHKDIVWYYNTPTLESALVAHHVCFYNEKVDIEVKGSKGWEKLDRPKTHFG